MVYKSLQIFLPFCHNTRVCQTDGQTDGQTDRILIARPRLHCMQRGNQSSLIIITSNVKPFFCTAYCSKNVRWRSRQFGTSAEVSARQFGTGADLSGHFGTNLMVPKCLGSEVSWVRSVLTPALVLAKSGRLARGIMRIWMRMKIRILPTGTRSVLSINNHVSVTLRS